MKRFFLVLILLFPVATLVFWVFHGDAIRPRKAPDANSSISAPTNVSSATNSPAPINKPEFNELPVK